PPEIPPVHEYPMNSIRIPAGLRAIARLTPPFCHATLCGCLLATVTPSRAQSQAIPSATELADANKDDASLMSEFKVYEKKPVPFTDANMDIPRGVNDVQPYYIIGAEEIENSGKANLDDFLKNSLSQNTISETNAQVDPNALTNQLGATSTINLRGL